MIHYLLDTNIASHIIKGDLPQVRARLVTVPIHAVSISAITQAELSYGVARRGYPSGLATRVREFLARVVVHPWTAEVGAVYGQLRADCEAMGGPLGTLDMMIAAHAKTLSADPSTPTVLVTRDRAFTRITGDFRVEDWAAPAAS